MMIFLFKKLPKCSKDYYHNFLNLFSISHFQNVLHALDPAQLAARHQYRIAVLFAVAHVRALPDQELHDVTFIVFLSPSRTRDYTPDVLKLAGLGLWIVLLLRVGRLADRVVHDLLQPHLFYRLWFCNDGL